MSWNSLLSLFWLARVVRTSLQMLPITDTNQRYCLKVRVSMLHLFVHKLDSNCPLQGVGRQQGELPVAILQDTPPMDGDVGGWPPVVVGPGETEPSLVLLHLLVEDLHPLPG